MSVTLTESPSPTSKADVWKVYTAVTWQDTNTLAMGSTGKGNQNQAWWMMFEPPIPAGSTLVSVELQLYNQTTGGLSTTSIDFSLGLIDLDGTWNVQASGLGWDEYATPSTAGAPTIHPSRDNTSDTDWVNNFPSFYLTYTIGTSGPGTAQAWSFGGGTGISPDESDAQFLTDVQDAFDANETNRTTNGVPIAFHMVPRTNELVQYVFSSNENATTSQRPILEIVYDPPPIASELSSTSSMDADIDVTYGAASELSSTSSLDADITATRFGASELSSTTALDAALLGFKTPASELSAQATLDAEAEVRLVAAAELASSTTVDAAVELTLSASAELLSDTTLDGSLIGLFFVDSELSSTTALDAEFRGDEVARPLSLFTVQEVPVYQTITAKTRFVTIQSRSAMMTVTDKPTTATVSS